MTKATTPLKIRRALPTDVPVLCHFQWEMALESEGLRLDPKTLELGVRAVFETTHNGEYWIAETAESEIIGCTLIQREWSDWRNKTVLWIHSLYVTPSQRGRGVFSAMYRFLKERVEKDPDLAGLRLFVDKRNETAIRAYEALKMSREHYDLYEWLKSG